MTTYKKNQENERKTRSAKARFRRPSLSSKLAGIPVFAHIILIFILLLIVFLFFSLDRTRGVSPLYREALQDKLTNKQVNLYHNVFGDHFVNELSINKEKTNFYFDSITTAYTFIPEYNWVDKGGCSDKYCRLNASNWYYPGHILSGEKVEYCISNNCLAVENNTLVFNEESLKLPIDVREYEIKNIAIYPLDSVWLLGFVYQDKEKEKGRVYVFDGNTFKDLDLNNEFPFVSRENFYGASFGFGGSDDNYLVLYGGYDMLGYQVVDGRKYNISRFLGLRVSGGGFSPIAFKQEREGETLWYVCSLSENKPRLIKLWQNKTESIKGSLALSKTILEDVENASWAWCRQDSKSDEIDIVLKSKGDYYRRSFVDNGFRQMNNYVLTSSNLLKRKLEPKKARFDGLLACANDCNDRILNKTLLFFVSGDGERYFRTNLEEEIEFEDGQDGLFWQITTEGRGGRDYSPWIDGLTSVSYSWWE